MNREQAKQLLPTIQAFADGEDVQYSASGWHTATDPTFVPTIEWRIKPKPLECWAVVDGDGDVVDVFPSPEGAKKDAKVRNQHNPFTPYTARHMREVTE